MKTLILLGLALVGGCMSPQDAQRVQNIMNGTAVAYKTMTITDPALVQTTLDEQGIEGWHLVGVNPQGQYIFSRQY